MPDLLGFQLGRKYTDGSSVFDVDVTEQIDPSTAPQVIQDATIDMNKMNPIHYGQSQWDNGIGYWLGILNGVGKFSIGNSAGDKLTWDGTTLTINGTIVATGGTIGGFTIGSDYIRDTANSFGLSSTVSGSNDVRFWAGDTFANRATAPFRIYEDGAVVMTSATINGIVLSTQRVMPQFITFPYTAAGLTPNAQYSTYTDDNRYFITSDGTNYQYLSSVGSGNCENIARTTIEATCDASSGAVKIGDYIYIAVGKTTVTRFTKVYRASNNNWAGGWTLMSPDVAFGTSTAVAHMLSDGTSLYFSDTGGDTASTRHIYKKYSISGTNLTYVSTITCGANDTYFDYASMDSSGNFYGNVGGAGIIRRYNSTGVLQATQTTAVNANAFLGYSIEGIPYQFVADSGNTVASLFKVPLLP